MGRCIIVLMDFRRSIPAALYEQVTAAHPYQFDFAGGAASGYVLIDRHWSLLLEDGCGPLAKLGADDLRRLLKKTFAVTLARGRKPGAPAIWVRVDLQDDVPAESYDLRVDPRRIEISARDDAGTMRALFHLGRRMLGHRSAQIETGSWQRRPRWKLRITSPLLHRSRDEPRDYLKLPQSYLLNMARYGYNATYLYMDWLNYMRPEIAGPLATSGSKRRLAELDRAVAYLGRFGLKLLLHANTIALPANHTYFQKFTSSRGAQTWGENLHCLCSSSTRVLEMYRAAARQLFEDIPDLGGAVLITGGECLLHCYTRPWPKPASGTNCRRCAKRRPEEVIAGMVNAFARGATEAGTDAPILMWPYSAFSWGDLASQRRLVEQLDDGVGLLAAFEKDDTLTINRTRSHVFDYSISQLGPSPRFRSLKRAARSRGLKMFAKTETSISIEMFSMPRIPVMQRWAQRFSALAEAQLDGVHSSWRLHGFCAQRTDEIVDYFTWAEQPNINALLNELASRDFGPTVASSVVQAWQAFSEAFAQLPYSSGLTGFPYFRGPFFIGCAQPLIFDLTVPLNLSERFWRIDPSMEEGLDDPERLEATRQPTFFLDLTWTQPFGSKVVGQRLASIVKRWESGIEKIVRAEPVARGEELDRLHRELDLARMFGCVFYTAWHLLRFQVLRDAVISKPCTPAILRRTCLQAREILEQELLNARTALTLVERDDSFGYTATYGRGFDCELIREKICHTQHQIDRVVPNYYKQYAFHMFGRSEDL